MTLCYVRRSHVSQTFDALFKSPDFARANIPIYNYFKNNYIQGQNSTRFDIEIWNCAEDDMLGYTTTNNSIEGYHGSLKKSFCNRVF